MRGLSKTDDNLLVISSHHFNVTDFIVKKRRILDIHSDEAFGMNSPFVVTLKTSSSPVL